MWYHTVGTNLLKLMSIYELGGIFSVNYFQSMTGIKLLPTHIQSTAGTDHVSVVCEAHTPAFHTYVKGLVLLIDPIRLPIGHLRGALDGECYVKGGIPMDHIIGLYVDQSLWIQPLMGLDLCGIQFGSQEVRLTLAFLMQLAERLNLQPMKCSTIISQLELINSMTAQRIQAISRHTPHSSRQQLIEFNQRYYTQLAQINDEVRNQQILVCNQCVISMLTDRFPARTLGEFITVAFPRWRIFHSI